MFTYDDETQSYYCSEYQFTGLSDLTLNDVLMMIENGELDNESI